MKLKRTLYYLIVIVFLVWCAVAFRADFAGITLAPILKAWDSIILAAALSLMNYLLRFIRWSVYLSRLGHSLDFGFSALSYLAGFAFTLSPGKLGEMIRGRYPREAGVPLTSTAAAFFAERLMDLLAMLALAGLAVGSSKYNVLIGGTVIGIALIMVMLVATPWARVSAWAHDVDWLPESLNNGLRRILRTLLSARKLLHPGVLVSGFFIGLIAWSCEGVGLMVISGISTGASMDMPTAVGIYAVAIVVGALSFLPGGLGSTETVMAALLDAYGYPLPEAIQLTLLCRLLTLWLAVAIGWLAVPRLRAKKIAEVQILLTPPDPGVPLCVDLDGTLIHTDLLLETLLLLLKGNPFYLFVFPLWLIKGKAAFKAEIAKRVVLNPATLPYNREFVAWLQSQRNAGRQLWLCTAANYRLAEAVAGHLSIFSGVFASSDSHNLSGRSKAKQLVAKFRERAFDYCGNNRVDLAIWRVSRGAVIVNAGERLRRDAEAVSDIIGVFPKTAGFWRPMLKALRPHQWAKNLLVFVPLASAHKLGDTVALEQSLLAFLAFGFCASSVYVLNDMLDLEADRQHPRKRKRPFASGSLSLLAGFAMIPLLVLATVIAAVSLPGLFWSVLAVYYASTVAYSFGLKRVVLVDIIALAGFYTLRIVGGAMAAGVALSFWLFLFSVFLFLSLALVKRYTELDAMRRDGKLNAAGRGYSIEDLSILHSLGTASGYQCVLVLALYINSPAVESLYRHPRVIWFLCVLLLYWISRVWLKAHRGKMHDDPIIFALKDRVSLAIGVLAGVTVYMAI